LAENRTRELARSGADEHTVEIEAGAKEIVTLEFITDDRRA